MPRPENTEAFQAIGPRRRKLGRNPTAKQLVSEEAQQFTEKMREQRRAFYDRHPEIDRPADLRRSSDG